jgi:hypothetical protein
MKKWLSALSVLLVIGFATVVIAEAGLMGDSGNNQRLPYGWYRVAPLVNQVKPPPPPPPPPSGGVDIGGGTTPRLLRGGETDNTDAGAKPADVKKETEAKPAEAPKDADAKPAEKK